LHSARRETVKNMHSSQLKPRSAEAIEQLFTLGMPKDDPSMKSSGKYRIVGNEKQKFLRC
jgi:hypothetical protein